MKSFVSAFQLLHYQSRLSFYHDDIFLALIDEALGFAGENYGVDDVDDAIGGFDIGDDDGRLTPEFIGEDTSA